MERVKETKVVEHLVELNAAKERGIPVFYSPHYTDDEFSWQHLNPIDKLMFERKMFRKDGKGGVSSRTPA